MITILVKYDMSIMISYQWEEWIDSKFGKENIHSVTEIRDRFGVLTHYEVILKSEGLKSET